MKTTRLTAILALALLCAGCFKDVSYKTTYILKPLSQFTSGAPLEPLAETKAYAFDADTAQWTVATYEDALAGVISRRDNPSEKRSDPYATAAPYEAEGTAGWLQMNLSKSSQLVVVTDPASRRYAFTQQRLEENTGTLYVSVVFRLWKEGLSYKDGNWIFCDEFYTPPVYRDCLIRPEVEPLEGGASEPLPAGKVTVYAYAADTTAWYLASYDDALKGIISRKSDPATQQSEPTFKGYAGSGEDANTFKITVKVNDRNPKLMLVAVDQVDRIYAYTETEIAEGGDPVAFPLLFRPWMRVWIDEREGWCFVDESLAPESAGPEMPATPTRKRP